MNRHKIQTIKCFMIFTFIALFMSSCTLFESLDELREEADDLLISYPKTKYKSAYIDLSHTNETRSLEYTLLRNTLTANEYDFIDTPPTDPNISDDTQLLAVLRQEIGTLILPEPNVSYSEKELRALELFVIFGGRLITTPPPSASISSTFRSLLSKFGMGVSGESIDRSEPMYFPSRPRNEEQEPFPAEGHVIRVATEIHQEGFHDFDKVVMLFPKELTFVEEHPLFDHTIITTKAGDPNKITSLKATGAVNTQPQKGFLLVLGDSFMAKALLNGQSRLPDQSAYQGGMITSGNFKFLINAIDNNENNIIIDSQGPSMNLEMATVLEATGTVSPTGDITDLGGIAKISFRLNNTFENIPLDVFTNPGQRRNVNRRIPGVRFIKIPVNFLNPGTNTLEITVTDQFLNESSQTLTFQNTLNILTNFLSIASTLPDSEVLNQDMGVVASGRGLSYPNRATFGGPLTESFWNGPRNSQCEEYSENSLTAFTVIRSAPQGAGRVESMRMPATQRTINEFNSFASLLTFHFEDLTLNRRDLRTLNHGEERIYKNADGNSRFIIQFGGIPIISAPMNDLTMILVHNAPRNCNDDVMTVSSEVLPLETLSVLPNLPAREDAIARAFLSDLIRARGLRFNARVFDRIIHGQNSYRRTQQGDLRFPIGVPHPDPAALSLDGFARIEVVGR